MRRLAVAVLLFLFIFSSAVPPTIAGPGVISTEFPMRFNPGLEENHDNFDFFSQTITLRSNPIEHVVADLNNDSMNDIAVIYFGSKVLDIFLVDPSNNFPSVPSQTITFLQQPTGLAAGYMDADKETDLVISLDYDGPNNIVICYQKNGFSSIDPQAKFLTGSNKQKDVLVHDLNGDGLLDVVALNSMDDSMVTAGFIVFRSVGINTYGFTSVPLVDLNYPDLITKGDLNGDGRQDLIIVDRMVKKVVCYRNDASAANVWTRLTPISDVIATSAMVEQASGDGREELFVALETNPPNTMNPVIRVLRYSNITSAVNEFVDEIPNQPQVTGLTMVLNSLDGRSDLARISSYQHNLTIFNTPALAPVWRYSDSISSPTPAKPISILPSDMNADGLSDLVILCNSSEAAGTLTIYYHSGTVISNANDNLVVNEANLELGTIGDLNGDGSQEIAFYDGTSHKIFFFNVTNARFDDLTAIIGAVALDAEDLNGDGKDELIIANATTVKLWWGSRTFFDSATSISIATSMIPRSIGFGDLDDDGDKELIVGCLGGLEIYWNSGSVSPFNVGDRFVLAIPGSDVKAVRTGLFSGDGDTLMDIAIVNGTADRVEIYYQQLSSSVFSVTSRILLTVIKSADDLVCGDLNGDGRHDLATHSNDTLYVFLQYPGGFYGAPEFPVKIVPGQGIDDLTIGNLDDQGILELALLSENSTVLAFSYDVIHATFLPLTNQTVGATPGILMIADLNRDGKDDLTVHSFSSRTTSIFYQNNYPPIAFATEEGSGHREGDAVWFNADGTFDTLSDQESLTYAWTFGDGLTGTGNRTSHKFMDNGTYNVVLKVTDRSGAFNITTVAVNIGDRSPTADFNHSGTLVEGDHIQFTDLSTSPADQITNWNWSFGDGQWSNLTGSGDVQHIYGRDGTFTVTLTVIDEDGSSDSASYAIVVLDSAPDADFSASNYAPIEGQAITFTDLSAFTADAIVGWSWDLGDGTMINRTTNASVLHTYADNGTYYVTLTVTDVDGNTSTSTSTVVVHDTSPTVSRLYIVGGAISFKEWDEVNLMIDTTPRWGAIVLYQWDFQTVTFQTDKETAENSTTYRYNTSGTHRITVRVWDSDSYTEISIQITITDPAPVPDFTYATNAVNRTVSFSAALTLDTENEILEYRWFFGDTQQTTWSRDDRTNHTYSEDGIYSVRLEVRDGTNPIKMKTRNVTIDLSPPVISMNDPVLKAEVGKPILIKVNVTDRVGIGSVVLEYTIGNVTRTVVMTHEGGGIYFAQIPAQKRTMELRYRIIANDTTGHSASTDEFTLVLEYEDPSLFIYSSLALLIAFLVIIIYLFLSRPIVDEVFVMYHDGTLLAHQTRRLKPGMDDEILGGMLIALQNFVRDSFKDENITVLRRMDFGDRKLLVERKDDFFIAVVLSGKRAGNAAQRMLKVLDNIDENYAPVLREWDGDLEKVRGIREETKPMFSRANPLDRLKRKEGEDDSI